MELNRGSLEPGGLLHWLGNTNFLEFSVWFFIFCVVVCVGVSLATPKPLPEKVMGLTYRTLSAEQRAANRTSYNTLDILLSLIVLGIVVAVMLAFRG
jgi:SSS family solute:Na+ symporter